MKTYSKSDLMRLAIEEHLKCEEFPRVGVVISKSGKILATGFRGETKGVHAERVAIRKLTKDKLYGATVFTTLEPCIELHEGQEVESCAQLLIDSGVDEVVIGVLDPNGTIYSQGFRKLLENNINVSFFNRKLRQAVEEETFEFGDVHKVYGCGKRRIPVVYSGTEIKVQFSQKDERSIDIKWSTLQSIHGCVDLHSSGGAIRIASGARNFGDVSDPTVFRFPSHCERLEKDMIAIVKPNNSTFYVLIQLIDIFENDIIFKWEVRNDK
ncbi:deaminase [uncultured Psychrobacter sp.]|uniref:deaminase n=1 Tax=uncultured Psychrobacter sp. TaxID=259303 RepID=UPI0026367A8C|nr:deaminase [uncultured Psychrobacter sp.]